MKLEVRGFALASGIIGGLVLLLLTLSSLLRGGGQHLNLLGSIYFGYCVSYLGCLLGLVYGFLSGFVAGGALAWLYNRLAKAA